MTRPNDLRLAALLLVLCCALLATSPTMAQEGCDDSERWDACYTRLSGLDGGSARPAQKAIADAAAEKMVEAKTTSDGSDDSAFSLASFLPRAVAALGFGEISEEEGSQTLTFNLSRPATGGTAPDQWTVSLVRRDAEPLEALVTAIPEAIRSDRKTALEDDLGDFDDVEMKVEYAFEGELLGRAFGRSFASYATTSGAVFTAVAPRTADDPAKAFLALVQELNALDPDLRADTGVSETRAKIAALRAEAQTARTKLGVLQLGLHDESVLRSAGVLEAGQTVDSKVEQLEAEIEVIEQSAAKLEQIELTVRERAAAEKKAVGTFQTELRKADYFRFADLVNNQPQLHFKGHYRQRDPVVGPDEWGIMATYEHGFGNVNDLRGKCGDRPNATCYQKFFKDRAVKSANRLAFSAEYGRVEDLRFELPDDDFVFALDEIRKTIFKLVYGRTLLLDDEGDDAARLDLAGSYEDVSDDPMRRSRGLITLTYTQNLIDNNTLSLSIVWANKPEYRGEVDHEWSARAGLKVKIDKND